MRNSGVDWAVLRPGGFASNALWWAESVRTQGVVAAPFGDTGVPIIDPLDIAEVAAACLVDDRHTGGVYELTGPAVITPREQAAAIAAALGSSVRFHGLTRAEAKAGMTRGMPAELADDTLDILGRPPRSFAEWVTRNVAAFR